MDAGRPLDVETGDDHQVLHVNDEDLQYPQWGKLLVVAGAATADCTRQTAVLPLPMETRLLSRLPDQCAWHIPHVWQAGDVKPYTCVLR